MQSQCSPDKVLICSTAVDLQRVSDFTGSSSDGSSGGGGPRLELSSPAKQPAILVVALLYTSCTPSLAGSTALANRRRWY